MNFGLTGLVDEYQVLKRNHAELVLATIIDTEGSTYRKAGARMLITGENLCHGVLGGQELHNAVLVRAQTVFTSRAIQIHDFDASQTDAGALDMELEAGARVTVMLEFVSCDDRGNTMELLTEGLQLKEAVLVTTCESGIEDWLPGTNILIPQKEPAGSNLDQGAYQAMLDIAGQIRESGQSSLESCISEEGSFTAFYDVINPPPHLLIIGAGPDTVPVLRLARAMEWTVTVADARQAYTQSEHLAPANKVITAAAVDLPNHIDHVNVSSSPEVALHL